MYCVLVSVSLSTDDEVAVRLIQDNLDGPWWPFVILLFMLCYVNHLRSALLIMTIKLTIEAKDILSVLNRERQQERERECMV